MMRSITLLLVVFSCLGHFDCDAQLMKKLKQKAGKGLLKEIGVDEKKDKPVAEEVPDNSSNNTNRANNTRGSGLKLAPPDVLANISDARSSLDSKSYSQVRFSIQEAMRGVELQIGEQVLASFPEDVSGLDYFDDQDQILTSGVGFAGLNIGRNYGADDQQLEVLINNNSVMVSSINAYMTNPAYMQSGQSDGTEYKRTTVQGNKALIEYSDYSGYQLSVPLGQSTLFIMKFINFESEDTVMAASDEFDLSAIKSMLGEN